MDTSAVLSSTEGPDPPSEGMKSTAFVVHFDPPAASKPRANFDPPLKFTRHTRNLSLPLTGICAIKSDGTQSAQSNTSSQSSPSPHSRSSALPRRVGYHSEGYFSSDQEDDSRSHSVGHPRRKEGLENGAKKPVLTPEKTPIHPVRPNMIRRPNDGHRPRMPTLSPLPSPSSPPGPGYDDTANNNGLSNSVDANHGDSDNENRSDTLSDAGTYTIDKEAVDVSRARQAIGDIFGVPVSLEAETEPFQDDGDEEDVQVEGDCPPNDGGDPYFKMSSSDSRGADWVDEWASRVVAHNQKSQTTTPTSPTNLSLPDDDSGHVTAHNTSPVHRPGRTSPVVHRPLRHARTLSAGGIHSSRTDDCAPETASLLRDTESVVTAMQARMTMSLSLDSGGESSDLGRPSDDSDVEPEQDEQPSRPTPTPPIRRRLSPATTENASIQTRHNRAFSLRRARLGSEKELPPSPNAAEERKKAPAPQPPAGRKGSFGSVGSTRSTGSIARSQSTATNSYNSTRTNSPKLSHPKTGQSEVFARTDCGRFSMRTPKSPPTVNTGLSSQRKTIAFAQAAPAKRPTTKKEGAIRNPATRSNSTLSSREVGFQNWKRRKSYDPMKAAAEGKKKDAKRTATVTASNPAPAPAPSSPANSSSPTSNQVLRSASFHGTHGLAPGYSSGSYDMSSEDDLTLSVEEHAPPLASCPSPAHLPANHVQYVSNMSVVNDAVGSAKLALYNSPTGSPRRAKIETFDRMMISAVAEFSLKLRDHAGRLLSRLSQSRRSYSTPRLPLPPTTSYLYESESSAAERLGDELELLKIVDSPANGSPIHQNSSRELSSAIRNLRRLESALLVLEDVLFEEEELVLH